MIESGASGSTRNAAKLAGEVALGQPYNLKQKAFLIGQFKVLDEGSGTLYLPIIVHFRTYPVIWSIRMWLDRCQTWWRCGPGPAPRPVKKSFHSDNFKHETRGIVCYKQSITTLRFYIFAHSSAQK